MEEEKGEIFVLCRRGKNSIEENFWSTEGKKEKETIILEKENVTTDGHRQ